MTETTADLDFARTALLVMDYQNGIVDSLPGAEELLDSTASAIAVVREHAGRVGYVRVGFTGAEADALPPTSAMAAAVTPERREAMHADSPATAIHERLAPEPGDLTVRKTRVGAFSTTDLDHQLRAAGITTLALAGVATSGVVLSTVRAAADKDYQLLVLSDACADPDPDVHAFLTQRIFPRQARVITTAELSSPA